MSPGTRSKPFRDTTPSDKYGPTPIYGDCEVRACEHPARTACQQCKGHYCRGHAALPEHHCTA